MPRQSVRRPFANFFIKKRLQIKIISTVLFVVFLTSCITTLLLAYIYNLKEKGGNYFYMSNNVMQDLELTTILGIILPALIAAQGVTLIIAFAVGLFSSRKAAVPVYKLEKWAGQIKRGNLKTQLGFRGDKAMKDLEVQCNALADTFLHTFKNIDKALKTIESSQDSLDPSIQKALTDLRDEINWIDYN